MDIGLNAALTSVGLSALASVGGDVAIGANGALTSVGLLALGSVGGDLSIRNSAALTSVGLSALASVGGNVAIENNGALTSLGLSALERVDGSVSIVNNPALSMCSALAILLDTVDDGAPGPGVDPVPDVGGAVTLRNNLFGCNSIAEVLQLVDLVLTVTDTPDPVLAGSGADNLTYTLELENRGPWDGTNVSVSVVASLPAGVTVSGSTAGVGAFDGNTWTVGPLAAGDPSVMLALALTVDSSVSSCIDCISVTATATADQDDNVPADNTDVSSATSIETAANASTSFMTTITFSNGYTGTASVTLTCNNGTPLQQSFDIAPDAPVNFVIQQLDSLSPDVNCSVTLDTIDSGYFGSSFTANTVPTVGACRFSGSPEAGEAAFDTTTARMNTCAIAAEPMRSEFTVTKEWLFAGNAASDIDQSASIHVYCSPAANDTGASFGQEDWDLNLDGDSVTTVGFYASPNGGATCYAVESGLDSSVESDQGCAAGTHFDVGDAPKGCTITNTVFFEGIPTLSQWGLALLALLTLGIGMVGVRRLV